MMTAQESCILKEIRDLLRKLVARDAAHARTVRDNEGSVYHVIDFVKLTESFSGRTSVSKTDDGGSIPPPVAKPVPNYVPTKAEVELQTPVSTYQLLAQFNWTGDRYDY